MRSIHPCIAILAAMLLASSAALAQAQTQGSAPPPATPDQVGGVLSEFGYDQQSPTDTAPDTGNAGAQVEPEPAAGNPPPGPAPVSRPAQPTPVAPSGDQPAGGAGFLLEQVRTQLWSTVAVAALAVVTLVIALWFMKGTPNHTAGDIVHLSALNFIVFGTIILVLVASTEQQLTAAMGVLGAIAGYLFGTLQRRVTTQQPAPAAAGGEPAPPPSPGG